ncbi:hypothetical protein QYS62_010123 [Fusarium acuminatum]|uniref:Uncharacterized protein n=1 Tax=Fusarium acuminatum TaxID=5515 RepID=A0ABZ2XAB1_9HYPO
MANGIADIAYWTTVPDFRGTRRQQYYSVYQEGVFGNPQMPSVWETQNLSSESEWSCDHERSCCTCDCDCQPIKNINQALGGHVNLPQNKPELTYGTYLQGYTAGNEPQGHSDPRGKFQVQSNHMPGVGFPLRRQDFSSVEDIIYYNAKQQRHLNDAQRRIQDWMRVMPDLVGNNGMPATAQESKKCNCRDCKDRKKAARKDDKKKKQKRKEKIKKKDKDKKKTKR